MQSRQRRRQVVGVAVLIRARVELNPFRRTIVRNMYRKHGAYIGRNCYISNTAVYTNRIGGIVCLFEVNNICVVADTAKVVDH